MCPLTCQLVLLLWSLANVISLLKQNRARVLLKKHLVFLHTDKSSCCGHGSERHSTAQVNHSKGEAGMLETRKAYEYALDRIGLDLHSAGLWQEYINYLQLPRPNTPAYRALWTSTAAPGQEEAQRVMTLRCCPCFALHNHAA